MPKRTLAVLGVAAFAALALPFGLPPVAHAAGTYTSIGIIPFPIAQPGSLSANTQVNICVQPRDAAGHPVGVGAPVWLSFYSGLFTSPLSQTSTAFAGPGAATQLNTTPQQFFTVASCTSQGGVVSADAIAVVYTTPTPTIPPHGRDVIIAADSTGDSGTTGTCPGSAGALCNNATYVYSPVTQYAFSSGPTIAPSGSLTAGHQVPFTVTAEDSNGNFAPGAFLDLSLTSSASNGGTATGWNHFSGFMFAKITNTPQRFGSDSSGAVQVTYTAANPLPTTGIDTIKAQDHIGVVTASGTTTYTYGSAVGFTQAPYTPLTPHRVCDTRPVAPGIAANQCNAAGKGPLTQGQTRAVTVTGGLVPSTATAVVVNLTSIAPTTGTFLTVYPAGQPSNTSNVNPSRGAVIATLVEVGIGTSGQIDVFNKLGTINIALDVEGYVDATSLGYFNTAVPARICDTRAVVPGVGVNQCNGTGAAAHPIGPGGVLTFNVSSSGSPVPTSGVLAVVFNLTAIAPTVGTVLTAYSGSGSHPTASNVNVNARAVVPNRVIVPVPSGCTAAACTVHIWNSVGSVNVAVDVDGWFGTATSAAQFTSVIPGRICDTRFNSSNAQGCSQGAVHAGGKLTINVTGINDVPGIGDPHFPTAVVVNVTAVSPTSGTFVTVYPGPATASRPNASDLNVPPGVTLTNLIIVGVDPTTGTINLFNAVGNVNLIVDVYGYYS
jgi:hypothetical protein